MVRTLKSRDRLIFSELDLKTLTQILWRTKKSLQAFFHTFYYNLAKVFNPVLQYDLDRALESTRFLSKS